jgi:hypothetical protein
MENKKRVAETLEEAKGIIKFVADTTKSSIKELRSSGKYPKPFEFLVQADTDLDFEIFIKGTKVAGDDYTLNGWKGVPIIKAITHQNFKDHPTKPNEYWVSFSGGGTGYGSDNGQSIGYIKDGYLKKLIDRGIEVAIQDFTEQATI